MKWVASSVVLVSMIHVGCSGSEKELTVDDIVDAIRQAVRPSQNMRIKWEYKTIEPLARNLSDGKLDTTTHTEREYTAAISGVRSRIEEQHRTYENILAKEPYHISSSVAVFNGKTQRKLTRLIKHTSPNKLIGHQYVNKDKNMDIVRKRLYGWPFDLTNPNIIRRVKFSLEKFDNGGICVLKAVNTDRSVYHFTIDRNKGLNIVKIERFKAEDKIDYEVNFKLKNIGNGTWYIAEKEHIRHPGISWPEARLLHRVTVTDIELDADILDSEFALEFPTGTKVWDDVNDDWFISGETGGHSG